MKKYIKFLINLLAIVFLIAACEENTLDPLTGKYPEPVDYGLTNLLAQNAVKQNNGTRLFTLKMATSGVSAQYDESTFSYRFSGTGQYLSVDFVGRDYFLAPGVYTVAPSSTAKASNYIAGYDADFGGMVFKNWGTCWFDIANGSEAGASKISGGSITVTKNGDKYTIYGTLIDAAGAYFKVNYAGTLIFPEDPPVYTYTLEVQKPYAWTADGTTYTPVAGSQLNKFTVFADGAKAAYLEVVTAENPASFSGAYPVSGEIRDASGAVVQGMYMDLSAFVPGLIIEGGSCLYDGENQYISAGSITIADHGGALTFTSGNLAIVNKATGGVKPELQSINYPDASLTGGGGGGGESTFPNLFSASALDLSMFGLSGFTVTLKVATPDLGVTVTSSPFGDSYTYAGSGQYISFDFSRDAGTLPAGVYNVVNNATAQVNDCLAGYPSLFGAGFMGTFVGNVVNGVATEEVVTGGVVTVTGSGFSFNLTTASGTIEGNYVGAITF